MTAPNAFGSVRPTRELYNSEPNIVKFYTAIHGDPRSPIEKPQASMVTGTGPQDLSEEVVELNVTQLDNGEWSVIVPQDKISSSKCAAIEFKYELSGFGEIVDRRVFEVSKRLMDFQELNEALGDSEHVDYKTFSLIEQNIRKIIESYCNQQFRSWEGTVLVEGYDGHIVLPEAIERLDRVEMGSQSIQNLLTNLQGYRIGENRISLFNPERDRAVHFFRNTPNTVNFMITGLWGYSSVPVAVHLAALELARNFLCDDIEYRRRYIDNIRFANTRIQFDPETYRDSTGNPIADDLLAPYRMIHLGAV